MRREIKEYIEDRLVKSPKPPRRWLKKTIPFKTAYACYVAGLSHAQTARVLGLPDRSAAYRLRKRVKQTLLILEEWGDLSGERLVEWSLPLQHGRRREK